MRTSPLLCELEDDTFDRVDRLFLWAIRTWSANHLDIAPARPRLAATFAREGASGALAPFHLMMGSIFSGLERWPDLRCVRCPRVGSDETRLLAALAALQRSDANNACQALRSFIDIGATADACRYGRECMREAAASGLLLSAAVDLTASPAFQYAPISRHTTSYLRAW